MRPVTSTAHPRGLPSSQPTLTYYILPCVLAHWLSTGGAASVFLRCASLPCALPSLQPCPLPRDPRGSHSPPSDFYSNSTFFEAFANCPSVSHCNRARVTCPPMTQRSRLKGQPSSRVVLVARPHGKGRDWTPAGSHVGNGILVCKSYSIQNSLPQLHTSSKSPALHASKEKIESIWQTTLITALIFYCLTFLQSSLYYLT